MNQEPPDAKHLRLVDPNTGETRVEHASGGAKGQKPIQFSAIPTDCLIELGRMYHAGMAKYPTGDDHIPNFWRGYPYSSSYDALLRHLLAFWGGEALIPDAPGDPTSGRHHLAAVVWHGLNLLRMELDDQSEQWDDRPAVALARHRKDTA